jgi:hypothetical protein
MGGEGWGGESESARRKIPWLFWRDVLASFGLKGLC